MESSIFCAATFSFSMNLLNEKNKVFCSHSLQLIGQSNRIQCNYNFVLLKSISRPMFNQSKNGLVQSQFFTSVTHKQRYINTFFSVVLHGACNRTDKLNGIKGIMQLFINNEYKYELMIMGRQRMDLHQL